MPFDDLRSYLTQLEQTGQLQRLDTAISRDYELAWLLRQQRRQQQAGTTLLCDQVNLSRFPVVTNHLGSVERLKLLFDIESPAELAERLFAALQPVLPRNWFQAMELLPQLGKRQAWLPRQVESPPCQQVVRLSQDIDLSELPFGRHWETDSGPLLRRAMLVTQRLEGSTLIVRPLLHVIGPRQIGLRWDDHYELQATFREYRERGRSMPVAIVLGGDPVLEVTTSLPLPGKVDRYLLAGMLRQQGVLLASGRTIEIQIPAGADLVLEGYLDPAGDVVILEPAVGPSGYTYESAKGPVIELSAMTHQASAILPDLVFQEQNPETAAIAQVGMQLMTPFLQSMKPEIQDIRWISPSGRPQMLLVTIDKTMPFQAQQVMHFFWGLGPEWSAKWIVVIDQAIEAEDHTTLWKRLETHVHPVRDILTTKGISWKGDHAAPTSGQGTFVGIDATAKSPEEGHPRYWPAAASLPDPVRHDLEQKWT